MKSESDDVSSAHYIGLTGVCIWRCCLLQECKQRGILEHRPGSSALLMALIQQVRWELGCKDLDASLTQGGGRTHSKDWYVYALPAVTAWGWEVPLNVLLEPEMGVL